MENEPHNIDISDYFGRSGYSGTSGYSGVVTPNLPIKPLSPLEKVQVAYLTQMGDANLIAEELGMSVREVERHLSEIHQSEYQDPRQLTANNVAMYVIAGIEMRMHHLKKQLKAINGRDQMWRSVCCRKPVEDAPAAPGIPATDTTPEILPTPPFKRCIGCGVGCRIELIDYPTIYRVRNETMRSIREETELYMATLERMHVIDGQAPSINVRQNIVVVDGKPQDYLKLGPMEMNRLLADLKHELVRMDINMAKNEEEIAKEEAELAKAEVAIVRDEVEVGQTETVDNSGKEETPGEPQAEAGGLPTRTAEEKG